MLEPWASRDPIGRVRAYLEKHDLWDGAAERRLIAEVDASFKAAVKVAEHTPLPPLESMFEDVYARPPWHLQEQRQEMISGPRAPNPHGELGSCARCWILGSKPTQEVLPKSDHDRPERPQPTREPASPARPGSSKRMTRDGSTAEAQETLTPCPK